MSNSHPTVLTEFARRCLTLVCASAPLVACAGAGEPSDGLDVETATAGLVQYSSWSTWPSNTIPVCFTPEAQSRSDYLTLKNRIIYELERSWSAVAKIRFQYMDDCPSTNPREKIAFTTSTKNQCFFSPTAPGGEIYFNVASISASSNHHSVQHEFGHALGFDHEDGRSDYTADPVADCAGGSSTKTVGTGANDTMSIMNCSFDPELSDWDDRGIASLYGRRVSAFVPLANAFNSANSDYYLEPAQYLATNGLVPKTTEGWGWYVSGIPGTTPLLVFVNDTTRHTMTVASSTGVSLATALGYRQSYRAGYVYTNAQSGATVPLKLYYNNTTKDFLTTIGTPPSGYAAIITEGHVFPGRPFRVLQRWVTDVGDLATTQDDSTLITSHGSAWVGAEGAVLRNQVEGTVALKTYWHSVRKDYRTATASPGAGWVLIRREGYAFSSNVGNSVPLYNWVSEQNQDYSSTVRNGSWDDYDLDPAQRVLGWVLPLSR